jgi:hypothetical protein
MDLTLAVFNTIFRYVPVFFKKANWRTIYLKTYMLSAHLRSLQASISPALKQFSISLAKNQNETAEFGIIDT